MKLKMGIKLKKNAEAKGEADEDEHANEAWYQAIPTTIPIFA